MICEEEKKNTLLWNNLCSTPIHHVQALYQERPIGLLIILVIIIIIKRKFEDSAYKELFAMVLFDVLKVSEYQ